MDFEQLKEDLAQGKLISETQLRTICLKVKELLFEEGNIV